MSFLKKPEIDEMIKSFYTEVKKFEETREDEKDKELIIKVCEIFDQVTRSYKKRA